MNSDLKLLGIPDNLYQLDPQHQHYTNNDVRVDDASAPQSATNLKIQDSNKRSVSDTVPTLTPQAFLSRDPLELSRQLRISIENSYNIRAKVAKSIILDPNRGESIFSRHVKNAVARIVCQSVSTHGAQNYNYNPNDESSIEYFATMLSLPPIAPCFVTALDCCIHSTALLEASKLNGISPTLKTGSMKLDSLLTPSSPKLINGGISCRIHRSVVDSLYSPTSIPSRKRCRDESENVFSYFGEEMNSIISCLPDIESSTGLYPGTVLEIFGGPATGKTQLALSIVANAILNHNNWSVRYLAGGGGSIALTSLARRLRQICQSASVLKSNESKFSINTVLDKVSFYKTLDCHHLLAALTILEEEMSVQGRSGSRTTDESEEALTNTNNMLIIIDSASGSLASHQYQNNGSDGGLSSALVSQVSLMVRRLARTAIIHSKENTSDNRKALRIRQCAVIIINGTVLNYGVHGNHRIRTMCSSSKPALGDIWKAADVRIFLDSFDDSKALESASDSRNRLVNSSKRCIRAHLIKHYSRSCSSSCESALLGVDQSGVIDF